MVFAVNLAMLAVDAGALLLLRRWKSWPGLVAAALFAGVLLAGLAYGGSLVIGIRDGHVSGFAVLGLLAWAIFAHGLVLLIGGALLLWEPLPRAARACAAVAAALALVAFDAFLVEPRWLEVTHTRIECPRLDRPIRVVVLTDIQTDRVGEWERAAVRAAMREKPDLVLLPGDYVQPARSEDQLRGWSELNRVFREEGLAARLGVHAVDGNVDPVGWERAFEGLGAHCRSVIGYIDLEGIRVTGIPLRDSFRTDLVLPGAPVFHLAFGHAPNFALGAIEADLLVAGHTHGGQVRLPFFGPPMTLSRVPRSWAAGLTALPGERWLYVSRGIGMERGYAPRLRFLCRPEVAVLDLVPAP